MDKKMKEFDLGLKENWKEFKELVENRCQESVLEHIYFVFHEEECDEAYIFFFQEDLENWLEKMFWDTAAYECKNLEDSMDDWKVWILVPESDVKRLKYLYRNSRITSIVIDGERQYRQLIPTTVEQTVSISSNWY